MRKEDVDSEVSQLAFEFFFHFSRFEFALKENRYLVSEKPGAITEPSWTKFVAKWSGQYTGSAEARYLEQLSPEQQVIGANGELAWKAVDLTNCKSELEEVVRLLKTVRNNLFHGGKHGASGWDNPGRIKQLLTASRSILGQLARLATIEDDYLRQY